MPTGVVQTGAVFDMSKADFRTCPHRISFNASAEHAGTMLGILRRWRWQGDCSEAILSMLACLDL